MKKQSKPKELSADLSVHPYKDVSEMTQQTLDQLNVQIETVEEKPWARSWAKNIRKQKKSAGSRLSQRDRLEAATLID
ncbi:MAG: hypothetical protein R3B93_20975 [Bacteroidia bacterium]